jgi:hypothetical protein
MEVDAGQGLMEIILFTGVAIAIYVASDRIVRWIETRRGGAMPQRQVAFFFIFLVLALTTFQILQRLLSIQ